MITATEGGPRLLLIHAGSVLADRPGFFLEASRYILLHTCSSISTRALEEMQKGPKRCTRAVWPGL
jgi:hypothetical protein